MNVKMNVTIKGRAIPVYAHEGDNYVEGRAGSQYEITITNDRYTPVEAVLSVDGLSVIDGEEAGIESTGYIINPRSTVTIKGWRLDDDSVAAFTFGGKKNSYSNQSGHGTSNVGVIGLMVFDRKKTNHQAYWVAPQPAVWRDIINLDRTAPNYRDASSGILRCFDPYATSSATLNNTTNMVVGASATATMATSAINNVGTEFGDRVDSKVTHVSWDRGDLLATHVFYYDDARGLKARGIEVTRKREPRVPSKPQAFPASTKGCTPPTNWKG